MTAGLLALGAGMALYGVALRPRPVLAAAGGQRDDHPGRGRPAPRRRRRHRPRRGRHPRLRHPGRHPGRSAGRPPAGLGRGCRWPPALVSGLCLLASVLVDRDGLFQRLGLTVAHAWVVVSALGLLRSPTSSSTTPPAPAPAARRR